MSGPVLRGVSVLSASLMLATVLSGCSTAAAPQPPSAAASAPISAATTPVPQSASPGATSTSVDAASSAATGDGACAYLTVSKLNALLARQYTASKSVPLPDPASAAYCSYTAGSAEFDVIVATTDPADALDTFNQAAGNKLQPGNGVGDKSLVGPTELVAVFGQTTIAASDSTKPNNITAVTSSQLAAVVQAVHAAM